MHGEVGGGGGRGKELYFCMSCVCVSQQNRDLQHFTPQQPEIKAQRRE